MSTTPTPTAPAPPAPTDLRLTCPGCRRNRFLPAELVGKTVQCRGVRGSGDGCDIWFTTAPGHKATRAWFDVTCPDCGTERLCPQPTPPPGWRCGYCSQAARLAAKEAKEAEKGTRERNALGQFVAGPERTKVTCPGCHRQRAPHLIQEDGNCDVCNVERHAANGLQLCKSKKPDADVPGCGKLLPFKAFSKGKRVCRACRWAAGEARLQDKGGAYTRVVRRNKKRRQRARANRQSA